MKHFNALLWLTTYRIFQVLMLISFIAYFSHHYLDPAADIPWTALVIPFVPVWVPFMYRLIFREDHPRQLWLYIAALSLFLIMEGFLFWPYTLFGFAAIFLNLGLSFAVAHLVIEARPATTASLAIEVQREPQVPQFTAPTGFEIELDALAARLFHQEQHLVRRTQHWQQQLKEEGFSQRERRAAEQALAISELNQAQVNLIRRFLALVPRAAEFGHPDRELVQRIQACLDQHESGHKILSGGLQEQLLARIQ